MHIIVLADTHMPRRGRALPDSVHAELALADLIIHLGDFTHGGMVRQLESYAPLHGVQGNNDTEEVRARFPLTQSLRLDGHTVRLLHGHAGGRTALDSARRVTDAEVVLFGHSHRAYMTRENGRLLFNPGSPTDPRWSPFRAFGIVDIIGSELDARIVPLD